MPLRYRFILLFSVLSTLLLVLVTMLVFARMEAAMVQQLKYQFELESGSRIDSLNHTFDTIGERFRFEAALPILRSMRFHQLTLNETAYQDDLRQLELYLLDQQLATQHLQSIAFISASGVELVRVEHGHPARNLADQTQDRDFEQALSLSTGDILVTTRSGEGGIDQFVWWIPVASSPQQLLGVLAFHVSADLLYERMQELAADGERAVCVANVTGSEMLPSTATAHCHNVDVGHWAVSRKLSLPGLAWTLTLRARPDSFLDDVRKLRWIVFALILPAVALLAVIVATVTSAQLTSAIRALVTAARQLGTGERITAVPKERNDELGELACEIDRAATLIEHKTLALQESNRELESYSYSIAHDLRTPLRSVISFGQLLQTDVGDKLTADERDMLNRIVSAGRRMSQLIDDILELSRIARGPLTLHSVDLSNMAADIAHHLEVSDPDRKVKWSIDEGMVVRGDPQLMRLLLENLLGNAWKYSKHEVISHIEFGSQPNSDESVYFVKDNGVGFDMEYVDKLFNPFTRLHSPDCFEGTGVGLATVQRIAQRHGGRVWAESEIDKYTVIYFTLSGGNR